jgi:hypothetical protein
VRDGRLLKSQDGFAPVAPMRVTAGQQLRFGNPHAIFIPARLNFGDRNDHGAQTIPGQLPAVNAGKAAPPGAASGRFIQDEFVQRRFVGMEEPDAEHSLKLCLLRQNIVIRGYEGCASRFERRVNVKCVATIFRTHKLPDDINVL